MCFLMLYQRLRDLREDADLTQKQVADLIGVSINHYGKYERGETDIPLEKAIILAKYYDVSLDYLAGLTNQKKSMSIKEQIALVTMYRSLNAYNQKRISEKIIEMLEQQKKK